MSTVSDLIKGSLRLIGAIAQGETPSSNASADALSALNDMLESWSNDGFLIYHQVIESLTLTASTASYTIGSSGAFNTTRPVRIANALVKQSGSNDEIPIRIYNEDEWAQISDKTLTSILPQGIYYDPNFALGLIYVWPVPSANGTLILCSDKPLTTYSLISEDVTLPPGYKKALRYNLAMELAPEYGKAISQDIATQAVESKALIMRSNTKPVYMRSDVFGLVGDEKQFNIHTGL